MRVGGVSLGGQNRPQEAPKGDKKRYRKKKIENRRKEDHQERQKELQKAVTVFGPTTGDLRLKEKKAVWSPEAPRSAHARGSKIYIMISKI